MFFSFFFSSRRRHTRSLRDWSSDVCSSDLSAQDHRGNLAAGARGVGRPLNERDRWLAGEIGPALAAQGMLFVGLDVIGGFVTEINVTSPTGIRELDKQFGIRIGELLMAAIERRLAGAPRRAPVSAA